MDQAGRQLIKLLNLDGKTFSRWTSIMTVSSLVAITINSLPIKEQ